MRGQEIFVTGGTSKIGVFLLKALRDKGYGLTVLCRKEAPGMPEEGTRYVKGDLLDPRDYISRMRSSSSVLHMAAVTHTNDTKKYYEVNAEGTLKLLEASKTCGIKRFIYVSTRAISPDGGHYSLSKAKAEEYVRKSGLDWIILRPAEIYGIAGEKGMNMLLSSVEKFPVIPVIGDGSYRIAPVHVDDVVSAIVSAVEKEDLKGKIYTISGPESFTYEEFINAVLASKGIKKPKIHIPVWMCRSMVSAAAALFKDPFMTLDQIPRLLSLKSEDNGPACRDLSFTPRSLADFLSGEKINV